MKKETTVMIRISKEEKEKIREKAEILHLSVARYLVLSALFFNPKFAEG